MSKLLWVALGAAVALWPTIDDAAAQRRDRDQGNWENLGCVEVGRRPEREEIEVGRREGRFEAIRFTVEGNDVMIEDVRVIYGDGRPDDLRVRAELREGDVTRPLDLEGRGRVINRIELALQRDFRGRGRGRARVCVEGREAARRSPPPPMTIAGWDNLGCVEVGRRPERETIEVGRREGRYSSIRLTTQGNDVRLEDLTVVYGNGEPDRLRVREELREGTATRPVNLQGRGRAIDRIEIALQRDFQGRGRGRATVCVFGEQARREPPRRVDWEELGCTGVALRSDSDSIKVGMREGRFKAIRLRARGNDIEIRNVTVIYGNGQPDTLEVGKRIREGDDTGPIDLVGGDRFIDRVDLRTKQDPKGVVKDVLKNVLGGKGGPIGKASICVDGLADDRFDRRARDGRGDGRGDDRGGRRG